MSEIDAIEAASRVLHERLVLEGVPGVRPDQPYDFLASAVREVVDAYFAAKDMISPEKAAEMQRTDYDAMYAVTKRWALEDGLVEVEPGHFVKPGEPYRDDAGVFHQNTILSQGADKAS